MSQRSIVTIIIASKQTMATYAFAFYCLLFIGSHSLPAYSEVLLDVRMQQFSDRSIPRFRVDASWPSVPDELMIGQIPGLAVDKGDNVWILQRPNSLGFSDTGLAKEPPAAVCCRPAPHVMQFSPEGKLLRAWGGVDHAPTVAGINQWPANVHGLYIDKAGDVWIAGNGEGDHVVLKFKADGTFVQRLGSRMSSDGNRSRDTLGGPADIVRIGATGETLIADGYINRRIIGFDRDGTFTRFWGAYGLSPDAPSRSGDFDQSQASSDSDGGANVSARSFGDIVHCIVQGPRGYIYVCDRRNNRIQVFELGRSLDTKHVEDIVIAPSTGGTRTVSDIAFSPDGQFMYVSDMMNGQVWILDAKSYEQLGALGRNGRYPGQFIWLHSVETDSAGNIYTTEVSTGRRVQKFVFEEVR
ncbi:MAG: hypothetical protein AAF671_08740 [Pseudomonadota bacterium]